MARLSIGECTVAQLTAAHSFEEVGKRESGRIHWFIETFRIAIVIVSYV